MNDKASLDRSAAGELIGFLQDLIRIDTTNPPGNEIEAARYLADVFTREGIDYTIVEPAPGRGNIVARLTGDGSKRPLLLMGHLDVVPVEPDKWDHPPFAAEIHDEVLWGRGSLDCKNTVALWLAVMLHLKRTGVPLKRDVIFLATADEETGHEAGIAYLAEHHYDLIDAGAALNEGGGNAIEMLDRVFFTYQSAEKGNLWLKITAHGKPGHGAVPQPGNPTLKVAALAQRLAGLKFPHKVTPSVRGMIEIMAGTQGRLKGLVLKQLMNPVFSNPLISTAIPDEHAAAAFRAMLRDTLCPTVLRAGSSVNVVPSEASLSVDYRILPGGGPDEALGRLKGVIGDGFEFEVLDARPPTESPIDHDLADGIKKAVAAHYPGALAVPFLLPGVTDGCFLRPKGMAVYGFTPLLPTEDISLVHGHNERISIRGLEFGLNLAWDVVREYAAG